MQPDVRELLAKLDPFEHTEALIFLKDLGYHYDEERQALVIVGPDQAPATLEQQHADIAASFSAWAEERGIMISDVLVRQPQGTEIPFEDYIKMNHGISLEASDAKDAADDEAHGDHEEGDHISDPIQSAADNVDNDAVSEQEMAAPASSEQNEASETNAAPFLNIDELMNAAGAGGQEAPASHDAVNAKEEKNPEEERQMTIMDAFDSNGLAIFGGKQKTAAVPAAVNGKPASGLVSQVKRLNAWRASRPEKSINDVIAKASDLEATLQALHGTRYAEFDAQVKARGGWDPEISLRFDDYIHQDKPAYDLWQKSKTQMKEYSSLMKKAIRLNGDNPVEAGEKLTSVADRIKKAAGKIPLDVRLGKVSKTIEEANEALMASIRRMVEKVTNLLFRGGEQKASAPSV